MGLETIWRIWHHAEVELGRQRENHMKLSFVFSDSCLQGFVNVMQRGSDMTKMRLLGFFYLLFDFPFLKVGCHKHGN